jgi:large subunit ribosomal protein L21
MYAIFTDGGRQYKVEQGQNLDIDFRESVVTGDTIVFDSVLAVGGDEGLKLGTPTLAGASVKATVVGMEKGDKVFIQKFRRRKNFDKRTGHRQKYTRVTIDSISV